MNPENPESLADGALDTLGCVFQTLGEASFPIDTDDFPLEFESQCQEVAMHIENGAAAPSLGIESIAGLRDWRTVRRFFIDRRREETEFVTTRLDDYRDIVEHFIVSLKKICDQNDTTEQLVTDRLSAVESAIEAGRVDDLRSALAVATKDVASAFALQKKEYEQQISTLNERVNVLREDLVAAKEEMQLDSLTGVCNRGAFDAALQRYINTQFILDRPTSVVMIDVDNFKNINDTLGHPIGDSVIKSIATCLSRCFIRKNDLIARFGGDEFAVILPDTDVSNSTASITRLLEAARRIEAVSDDELEAVPDIRITCSIGCTEIRDGDTAETLLNRADQALYEAKQAGRNCFRTI